MSRCLLSILTVFLLLLSHEAVAQSLDSLKRTWSEITDDSLRIAQQLKYAEDLYGDRQYHVGHEFIQQMIDELREEPIHSDLIKRSTYLSTIFAAAVGDQPSFCDAWINAFQACNVGRDTACLIELYKLQAGQYTTNFLRYDSAYIAYQKALDLALAREDKRAEYTILNNMAIIFSEQGLMEKAKNNFFKVAERSLQIQDTLMTFLGYHNVASCFIDLEEPDSVEVYQDKARNFMIGRDPDWERSLYYESKALLAKLKSEDEQALQYFHRALYYSQQASDVVASCHVLEEIGRLHHGLMQHDSAQYYLQQVERFATQLEANDILRDVLPVTAESYAETENWYKAYSYAEKSLLLRDEYLKEEIQRQVAEMEAKYQLSNYVKENELLKTIASEREAKVKARTFYAILGFMGLLVISALGVLIWRRNQTIQVFNTELEGKVTQRTADLKATNQQLEDYLEDLRVFTHVTSHDLKEPLRNISGLVSLLGRRLEPQLADDSAEFMEMIRVNANQMHELVKGIQFYAKLEPNEESQAVEAVELSSLLEQVKATLEAFIEEKDGKISLKGDLPTILFSEQALQVVLKNLIENGLKYNDTAKPEVVISCEETQTQYLIHIRDNGIGIEPNYYEQIFQMFKRLHTRQHYSGTGMGLAISRKLLRRFGGDIQLESTPGKGSVFTVVVPKTDS